MRRFYITISRYAMRFCFRVSTGWEKQRFTTFDTNGNTSDEPLDKAGMVLKPLRQ